MPEFEIPTGPSGTGSGLDAIDMGNIVRVAHDVFDSGLRMILVFEAEQKSGRKEKFACVVEENVMLELIDALTDVADARSKVMIHVKQVPPRMRRLIDESRNG